MSYNDYEIIDFHTHPFIEPENNLCEHKEFCNMGIENTKKIFDEIGIAKICGSPIRLKICEEEDNWESIHELNLLALKLRDIYGDFYTPGIHVSPHFVKESCDEIEKFSKLGVKLIGEVVPWIMHWGDEYDSKYFGEIIEVAKDYGMIVSLHSACEKVDQMDRLVKDHPGVTIVAAHPGEYYEFSHHMERMKYSENYYLDVSGYGIFRHGALRHALDLYGKERFLFGSDFPTCNPAMYLGGVILDPLIKEDEKEYILSKNAKRLLNI